MNNKMRRQGNKILKCYSCNEVVGIFNLLGNLLYDFFLTISALIINILFIDGRRFTVLKHFI